MPNKAHYYAWGPHQRVSSPIPALAGLADVDDAEWPEALLLNGVWTIFPHVSIASFDVGGRGVLISQLFPGSDALSSVTVQNYLMAEEPTDEQREVVEKDKGLSFKEFLHQGNVKNQTRFIFDEQGNKLVDHILRFENINDDINTIINKLSIPVNADLPHINASQDKGDYREYYTSDDLIEFVSKNAAKDIDYFGYTF